jgi:hypothetical protein
MIKPSNCFRDSRYVQDCLKYELWARAADYLRMHYLYTEGGIYLDADMELLQDLDDYLTHLLVCEREDNGFIANSFLAVKPGHRLVKAYLDRLEATPVHPEEKDGTWHSGMGAWTVLLQDAVNAHAADLTILEVGSLRGIIHHHYAHSWNPSLTGAAPPLMLTPA